MCWRRRLQLTGRLETEHHCPVRGRPRCRRPRRVRAPHHGHTEPGPVRKRGHALYAVVLRFSCMLPVPRLHDDRSAPDPQRLRGCRMDRRRFQRGLRGWPRSERDHHGAGREGTGLRHLRRRQVRTGACPFTRSLPHTRAPHRVLLPRTTLARNRWHLGQQKRYLPLARGFDHYLGIPYSVDMGPSPWDMYTSKDRPPLPLLHGNDVMEQPTDLNKLSDR